MLGVLILVGAAVVMIVGAVFIYSGAENTSFDRFNTSIGEVKGSVKTCVENYEKLSPAIEELSAAVRDLKMQRTVFSEEVQKVINTLITEQNSKNQKLGKAVEILTVRQSTMEKRQSEFSGELKANSEKPHKVTIAEPVEIIYLKQPPKPLGQGKDSLLKRSGITTELSK